MKARIINITIIILVTAGLILMFTNKDTGTGLMSRGFGNLKYYTVLSNLFAGIAALVSLFTDNKLSKVMKLMSASATGVTFAVIAFFLGPLYGHVNLYRNANFLFHLVVPLIAMYDYVTLKDAAAGLRSAALSAVPTVLYGAGYVLNILINGIGGEYPDTNDFYLFLHWGWGVGIAIFAGITAVTFGIACLLRWANKKIGYSRNQDDQNLLTY